MPKVDPKVVKKVIDLQLASLATLLSKPDALKPSVLAETLVALRDIGKTLDDGKKGGLEPAAKKLLVELVKAQGHEVEGAQGLEATLDGWRLPIRPYRTGLDAKKVESLLRAKKKDPSEWMTEVKSYILTDADKMSLSGVLNKAELMACEYEESWTVATTERI